MRRPSKAGWRSRALSALVMAWLVALAWPAVAQAPGSMTSTRFAAVAAMDRADQRAPDVQRDLERFTRRAALLYLRHLDGLAARPLFSLGDASRFAAAVGSTDGTDHNRIFVEGTGAPMHVDDGPYVLPTDYFTRYGPAPTRNTTWHEVQHDLLHAAGVGVNPRPYADALDTPFDAQGLSSFTSYTTDYHHPFIEGVGQRGAEAYDQLVRFEASARRAHAEQQAIEQHRTPTFAELRNLWSGPHHDFSRFTRAWERVARMPDDELAAYRGATGIFFSPPEEVATFYRQGGLKAGGQEVHPPKWVFYPTLLRMPVRIRATERQGSAAGPPERLVRRFEVGVFARASVHEADHRAGLRARDVGRALEEGSLQVILEGGAPQAFVQVATDQGAVHTVSSRHRTVALDGEAIEVAFVVPDLRQIRQPTSWTILLAFADERPTPLFDTSERRIVVEVDPPQQARARPAPRTPAAPAQQDRPSAPADRDATTSFDGHWKQVAVEVHFAGDDADLGGMGEGRAREVIDYEYFHCVGTYRWDPPRERYGQHDTFELALEVDLEEVTAKKRTYRIRGCGFDARVAHGDWPAVGRHGEATVWYNSERGMGPRHQVVDTTGRFPTPARPIGGGAPIGSYDLAVGLESGWIVYKYEWVSEEPEEDEAEVRVQIGEPSDRGPVPPPYTDDPIEPEELTGPRPPVEPPDDGAAPPVRPTVFGPPGGDYRITIPAGWRPLARADGEYLYVSPHGAWVLACPRRARTYEGSFAQRRQRLAAQLLRRGVGGDPVARSFGRHEGLVVDRAGEDRHTSHAFVASEGRAVAFRVVAGPGVQPPLPGVLEEAFATVQWTAGGPGTAAP